MAVDITVRDGIAYLSCPDPELWEQIVDSTSFKLEGSSYTRGHNGDKRTKLVRHQKCPVGLLDRVCRTIIVYGDTPNVSYADTQMASKPRFELELVGVEPRDYQIEAALAAILYDRGIFRMPTGSGKTLVGLQIIQAKSMWALVIVPTIDLLHQTRAYLIDHLVGHPTDRTRPGESTVYREFKVGQLGDGVVDPQPVTVATIRTIAKVLDVAYESYEWAEYDDKDDTEVNRRSLKDWVESIGTVIADEAHQIACKSFYSIMNKISAPNKYGMSASPWRDDGADLMIEAATGPPIFYVPPKRLVEEGYLMAPEIRIIDTSGWWQASAWGTVCTHCNRQQLKWAKECRCGCKSFRSQFPDAYKKEIVENPIRNQKIAEIVQELDRSSLVLVKQIKHGRLLADLIPGSIFLSGRDKGKDRQEAFDRARSGEKCTLICTTIADQGLDIPSLGALVLAAGGKSSTRHLQRIGRIVRPSPNKQQPLVVDFTDAHVHSWFANHAKKRRKIEAAEWTDAGAIWTNQ